MKAGVAHFSETNVFIFSHRFVYVFLMTLIINSDYFPEQYELTDLHNGSVIYLLEGRN